MSILLFLVAFLFGCPVGKASTLRPSRVLPSAGPVASVSDVPVVPMTSCQGEPLQTIRTKLLEAFSLKQAPDVNPEGMSELRDHWKAALSVFSKNSETSETATVGNTVTLQESYLNNSKSTTTRVSCCKMTSQVFIKDLGWETWILHPESFAYAQCVACAPHRDRARLRCGPAGLASRHHAPQVSCCGPVAFRMVPFIYLDHHSTLTISNIPLVQDCSCTTDPGTGMEN
ncbi:gonadal somatic cell derived factor [Lepisosteus oculatus]|uniref:gonadal somatic cell derived factor n=1 Tax=Lepisosteus oculatus TaxID=7918 RepID=UPI00073FC717|nr:PREDICTED: bone morphogenetic protein 7-like [Lepisosteus oculatus]